jgi:uncharacterized protein
MRSPGGNCGEFRLISFCSFEQASAVFSDPLYVSVLDRIEDGEPRWQTLGFVEGLLLLVVAHTVREERDDRTPHEEAGIEVIRIISARRATRKESRRYEEENG